MKASVIIPTYKPGNYIFDLFDSLNNQTLESDQFEVIVVLNGPKEPFWGQLTAYDKAHNLNLHIIYSEQAGVSVARNLGLNHATGQYITFMDDDDLITVAYLEELLGLASDDTVALSYLSAFDDITNEPMPLYITEHYQEHHEKVPYTKARRYFYVPFAKMIHRDIIADRRFDTTLKNSEDALFMFLISDRIKWVRFTDKHAEYRYRQRSNSAFNVRRPSSYYLTNMLQCLLKATRIYFSRPTKYSFAFYVKFCLASIMGCIRHLRRNMAAR